VTATPDTPDGSSDGTDQPGDSVSVWSRMYRSRFGSVLLSWDFLAGLLAGVGTALIPALSKSAQEAAGGILAAVGGIGAGLAALVLTALTVLIGALGRPYRTLLNAMPTGLRGVFRPYVIVIGVSIAASLVALVLCLAWPLIVGVAWPILWAVTSIPFVLVAWALFGCMHIIQQLIEHVENNSHLERLEERRQRALARRSGTA